MPQQERVQNRLPAIPTLQKSNFWRIAGENSVSCFCFCFNSCTAYKNQNISEQANSAGKCVTFKFIPPGATLQIHPLAICFLSDIKYVTVSSAALPQKIVSRLNKLLNSITHLSIS